MVWPTICGKMVDARDQVLTTRLETPGRFISSIRRNSLGATYGPFLSDLDISYLRFLPRRRTIHLSVALFRRVFLPNVGLPQGDLGPGIPMGERPSPPPCG